MSIQLPGAEFSENMSTHKIFCLNTGLWKLTFGVFLKYSPHKTFFEKLFHYFIFSKIISFNYHWKEDTPSTRPIIANNLFIVTRPHCKNLPQNAAWKFTIWLQMRKKIVDCMAKSRSARGASHHPAFIVSCLTVNQICLPCQPSR